MNDLVPVILVGALAILLVVGLVMYWRMLDAPMDEWDDIDRKDDSETDQKD